MAHNADGQKASGDHKFQVVVVVFLSLLFYSHVNEPNVVGAEITVVTYEENTFTGCQFGGRQFSQRRSHHG